MVWRFSVYGKFSCTAHQCGQYGTDYAIFDPEKMQKLICPTSAGIHCHLFRPNAEGKLAAGQPVRREVKSRGTKKVIWEPQVNPIRLGRLCENGKSPSVWRHLQKRNGSRQILIVHFLRRSPTARKDKNFRVKNRNYAMRNILP